MVQPGKTVRPLQPKSHLNSSQSPSTGPELAAESKATKRRCVSTACIPCRKRKSKCDGSMPVCSTCTAVYKTECSYDADADTRRKTTSKRDSSVLRDGNDAAAYLISCLKSFPDSDATDLLYQIRSEENLDALVESLRKNISLQKSESLSLEGDYSYLTGKELTNSTGQTKHYGHTSNLGLVATGDEPNPAIKTSPQVPGMEGWTSVTTDLPFIEHLLKLYFTWQHPFYVLFKEDNFRRDFKSGRTKYCSALLVNAICAYACHYSDLPAARKSPEDQKTAGDHFFAEARELLFKNESSSLTSCQALLIMSMREASSAREDSGFQYAGRAMRMAIELGLQLPPVEEWRQQLSDQEVVVRNSTFWGIFTCDTAWSVCIGRISQLPRSAIGVEKPPDVNEVHTWTPYTDEDFTQKMHREQYEGDEAQFLLRLSTLSELVNDTVYMFYAPRDRLTSRKLLDRYRKYEAWHKALPSCLQLTEKSPPHFYHLHMYYWTCILHLFRPFLQYELQSSDIRPIQTCKHAANHIRTILDRYRQKFTLRCGNLLASNLTLSICTVHLLDLPRKGTATNKKTQLNLEAEANISKTLKDICEIAKNHHFAARCFKIICSLAEKWGAQIPPEVFNGPTPPPPPPPGSMVSPTTSGFYAPAVTATSAAASASVAASMEQTQRRSSVTLNLTLNENARFNRQQNKFSSEQTPHSYGPLTVQEISMAQPFPSFPTSAMSSGVSTQSAPPMTSSVNSPYPQTSANTMPSAASPQSSTQSASTPPAASRENFFWSPFPGQGIPLIGNNFAVDHPMDISSILGQVSEFEQFNRDGFIRIGDWNKYDASLAAQRHQHPGSPVVTMGHGPHTAPMDGGTANPTARHTQEHGHQHQHQMNAAQVDSRQHHPGMPTTDGQHPAGAGRVPPWYPPPWWSSAR